MQIYHHILNKQVKLNSATTPVFPLRCITSCLLSVSAGVSGGAIAGIIIGVLVLLTVIALVALARSRGKWCFAGEQRWRRHL